VKKSSSNNPHDAFTTVDESSSDPVQLQIIEMVTKVTKQKQIDPSPQKKDLKSKDDDDDGFVAGHWAHQKQFHKKKRGAPRARAVNG
jgi:hypothetical protein